MENDCDAIDDEMIERLGEDFILKLNTEENSYQCSIPRLARKVRRRKAFRLLATHSLAEIAKAIGLSEKQTERILAS